MGEMILEIADNRWREKNKAMALCLENKIKVSSHRKPFFFPKKKLMLSYSLIIFSLISLIILLYFYPKNERVQLLFDLGK